VHQYKNLALPFFTDYAAEHDGRHPYINPGPRVRWAWGQENGGDTGYEMALRNKTIFKDWWESQGYGVHNEDTCSEGIYIYPYSTGKTQYRDVYTRYVLCVLRCCNDVVECCEVNLETS
jgi:hypothetical protein